VIPRHAPQSFSARLPRLFPRNRGRLLLFGVALAATALAVSAGAAELRGTVVGVSDGDTLTVLDQTRTPHRIRLAGIDAPEMKQPYGARARSSLASLAFQKPVVVVWHKRDRYGRIVGHVDVVVTGECGRTDCARREDVALAQLASGLAWHYKRFQGEQTPEERRLYAVAEDAARARREGLWQDPRPVPPWEFRNGRRPEPEEHAGASERAG